MRFWYRDYRLPHQPGSSLVRSPGTVQWLPVAAVRPTVDLACDPYGLSNVPLREHAWLFPCVLLWVHLRYTEAVVPHFPARKFGPANCMTEIQSRSSCCGALPIHFLKGS